MENNLKNNMKAVIKSYLKYFFIICVVIILSLLFIGQMNYEFIEKNYSIILSALFYSFGTLGFLVNVTTWDGVTKPEKTSKLILILCYCIGVFFTILSIK